MGRDSPQQRVRAAVSGWPGVTIGPHRSGGVEIRYGCRELGHLHGDRVSFHLGESADLELAIDLLRRSYELAVGRRDRHTTAVASGNLAE